MAIEDNEQQPALSAEAAAQQVPDRRELWDLSRDDQRLLIITFVGGLASLVAGACVIGGAIALVRGLRAIHHPLVFLIFLIFLTAVDIFYMIRGFKTRRSLQRPWPREVFIKWVSFWAGSSILLLVWIGLAAGIK
jgi:hypothetical protein